MGQARRPAEYMYIHVQRKLITFNFALKKKTHSSGCLFFTIYWWKIKKTYAFEDGPGSWFSKWATKKNPLSFCYSGWLIGILIIFIMVYYNPYITGFFFIAQMLMRSTLNSPHQEWASHRKWDISWWVGRNGNSNGNKGPLRAHLGRGERGAKSLAIECMLYKYITKQTMYIIR